MAVFICPNCLHTLDTPDAYVGRTAKCPKCKARGEIKLSNPKSPSSAAPISEPNVAESPIEKTDLPSKDSVSRTFNHSVAHGLIVIMLLAAILVAQLFGLMGTMESTLASKIRWEYTVVSPSDDALTKEFERLGDAGWELVFARRANSTYGSSTSYEMIFKRLKHI